MTDQPKRVTTIEPGVTTACVLCMCKGTKRHRNIPATFRLSIQADDGVWTQGLPICGYHAGEIVKQGAT